MSDDYYYNPTIIYRVYGCDSFSFELYKGKVEGRVLSIGDINAELELLQRYRTMRFVTRRDTTELDKCIEYMKAQLDIQKARELMRLMEIAKTLPTSSAPTSSAPTTLETTYNEEQLTIIFNALVDNGYLDRETDVNDWLYCYGKGPRKSLKEPLKWLKWTNTLGWMVGWVCDGESKRNRWVLASQFFVLCNGKHPNINTLASKTSRANKGVLISSVDALNDVLMLSLCKSRTEGQ